MIEQIKQSQLQLLALLITARLKDHKSLEIEAQDIAQKAFPGGHWPYNLSPWPEIHIHLAALLVKRKRWIDALMHGVKGYMFLERRTGKTWVWHLFDLLQILMRVLHSDNSRENSTFPTGLELLAVFFGYLHELSLAAIKVFGTRVKYSQAIKAWYSDSMKSAGTIVPGTRLFAQRFEAGQSRLLLWAGVDEKSGIALTK